jgi:hypothetical protein
MAVSFRVAARECRASNLRRERDLLIGLEPALLPGNAEQQTGQIQADPVRLHVLEVRCPCRLICARLLGVLIWTWSTCGQTRVDTLPPWQHLQLDSDRDPEIIAISLSYLVCATPRTSASNRLIACLLTRGAIGARPTR